MTSEPDEDEALRNYFASYEMDCSSSGEPIPVKFERDLEYRNCAINCCLRFLPKARLQLRAWYQRLTPQGQTTFLNAHLREASPGHIQCRLPMVGTGALEKVCMTHFKDTLYETKERIRSVILEKRKPLEEEGDSMECGEEGELDLLPVKRYKKGTEGAAILMDRMARGLSYRTRVSKRLMPARKVKVPCDSVCRYKCFEKYTLEERQQKLRDLLQMPLEEQRQFLSDHVCKMAPIRTRALSPGKRLTIYYFFREGRQLHRVCKTMFLNTYDISDRRLRELLVKKGANTHVICGNPMLASVLKKYQYRRMVYDIDEGLDKEADKRILEEFLAGEGSVNFEGTPHGEEYDEISIDYGTIKQELDDTEQEIFPDESPASNNRITQADSVQFSDIVDPAQFSDRISPDCDGASTPTTVWIKTENMDVEDTPTVELKAELVDPEAEQQRSIVPLPRCDNLVFADSKYEPETYDGNSNADSVPPPRGRHLMARLVKSHCGTKCHLQCYTRVSDELRLTLLANLHKMSSTDRKKYIGDHICATPSLVKLSRSSKRRFSSYYFLPAESRLVKVCKLMFCSTFDLNAGQLLEIIKEKGDNKHVVCGNPNFASGLKKKPGYYFDYNLGTIAKTAEEACKCSLRCWNKFSAELMESLRSEFHQKTTDERYRFLSKYVRLPTGEKKLLYRARFFLPLESSSIEEVCRKMFLFAFKADWHFVRVLLSELEATAESIEQAKAHIATYRMDEDHHCEVAGENVVRKLSHCPNVARMYNEYLEGHGQRQNQSKPIDYEQYFGEFSRYFTRTGLMLPTKCPDCGFFSRGDMV